MAEQQYPSLNGIEPSWADLRVSIPIYGGATLEVKGITAVNWGQTVEVGESRSLGGGGVTKTTTGKYSSEGGMTMYASAWRELRKALAGVNKRISLVGFDLIIQFTPPGEDLIYNIKLAGIRVLGTKQDASEGVEPNTVELTLHVKRIEEDGEALL